MAKSLKTLATQLRRNHGVTLIPTLDAGIEPGTLLTLRRWNDITRIGKLTDDASIRKTDLGPIEGPTPCLLADFTRSHDLSVDAALELLQPGAGAAEFRQAREVSATFGAPVTYTASLIRLEDAVERDPSFWDRTVGQHLSLKRTRVVFQVIRARLSFLFRSSGGAGIDLRAGRLRRLGDVGLSGGWSWRNEATLESRRELVVAVEAARYRKGKKRFD